MNERNLSRRLSSSVVDALKAHGHILVVKGGATALARELDDLMAPEVTTIEPRLKPNAPLVGEPTSTFGDETVDQAVEDMVQKLTHALMKSDHVEDVFAEDAVIRRDIFRVVRDGLREPAAVEGGDEGDHQSVTVKLDTLGYVAATAGRRADPSTLRHALDRAAGVAGARFAGFSPDKREATFRFEGGGVDERLEIEEAVADELTDLVEQGVVELPTIERRIELGRALPASEQRALRARIDAAAEATLLRSGCAASWEFEDPRTLRILFTPLSEQDARGIDPPTSAFAREIAALLAKSGDTAKAAAKPADTATPKAAAASTTPKPPAVTAAPPSNHETAAKTGSPVGAAAKTGSPAGAPSTTPAPAPRRKAKETAEPAPPSAPAPSSASKAAAKTAAPAKKSAAKKSAAKAPASSRKGVAAEEKPSAASAGTSRSGGKRAPAAAAKSTKKR